MRVSNTPSYGIINLLIYSKYYSYKFYLYIKVIINLACIAPVAECEPAAECPWRKHVDREDSGLCSAYPTQNCRPFGMTRPPPGAPDESLRIVQRRAPEPGYPNLRSRLPVVLPWPASVPMPYLQGPRSG